MEKLRWVTGGASALFCALYVAFFLFANSFRRSFGASPNAVWKLVVPLVVAGLVLASTLWPGHRWLLHLTALAVGATAVGSLAIIRQAPFIATLGLAYCGAWLAFYILTLNPPRPTP